jgi:hypothetical protein
MQKRTRSLLEELESMHQERDSRLIIETRARNLIENAIRLFEQIEHVYTSEQAENLQRKLLNAIRNRDSDKFARSVRRTNVDE